MDQSARDNEDMNPEAITTLSDSEAWDFLAARRFGRLALTVLGKPEIFPINYATSGQSLLFRTAEGTKLVGMVMDNHVAFEVDQVGVDHGVSVVLKGVVHEVESEAELDTLDLSGLHSWIPTLKYHLMVIQNGEITGRRFDFGPEPDLTPVM